MLPPFGLLFLLLGGPHWDQLFVDPFFAALAISDDVELDLAVSDVASRGGFFLCWVFVEALNGSC